MGSCCINNMVIMRKLKYILIAFILYSCTPQYYTIEETKMVSEGKVLTDVKKCRAKQIQRKLQRIGVSEPKYKGGEMKLYFEHLDSTIRFRPKEIKELQQQ